MTSSWGGTRYMPMVFTEQGVPMLSSVLNSEWAIEVNIQIMRTFTKLKQMILSNDDLRLRIEEMEKKYGAQFQIIFLVLENFFNTEEAEVEFMEEIGFKTDGSPKE